MLLATNLFSQGNKGNTKSMTADLSAGAAFNSIGNSKKETSLYGSFGLSKKVSETMRCSGAISIGKKGVGDIASVFLQPEISVSLHNRFPVSPKFGVFAGTPIQFEGVHGNRQKGFDAGLIVGGGIHFGVAEAFIEYLGSITKVQSDKRNNVIRVGIRGHF